KPELLLADEPTGSLDDKNAAAVVEMILELADAAGAAVLLASHDATVLGRFAQRADLADWNRA
ncbi:MAG: ABC transporter ATP-binding protein, partial [Verrucomicrobiae bacterium]|nr:ABC transporter ATP-binding protein [Verrucomicrobiae bacterium]